ncbi:hypothetical protein SAY87_017455 [Trapa incisa]|uniref:Pectinesterase inhibitor domain-containing protein n=1 Tax=Trapa incisa TaxID=236973 RepID=A0AAN7KVU8_9MYRT|nr:hypothetical protein SAY87_017455 [Trapa incisa]
MGMINNTVSRLVFLVLLTGLPFICYGSSATGTASTISFIKSSCSSTRYPTLCVQSLTSYASAIQQNNKQQLAQAALSESLVRAHAAKEYVAQSIKFRGLRAREYAAIKDCLEQMGDSVDRLSKSVEELKGMHMHPGKSNSNQPEFIWHVSNIQTWVSAALTDVNTCFDGYSSKALNGKLKTSIRERVLNVAQVTSNALALVNRFASS